MGGVVINSYNNVRRMPHSKHGEPFLSLFSVVPGVSMIMDLILIAMDWGTYSRVLITSPIREFRQRGRCIFVQRYFYYGVSKRDQ
jgi:hypothetical protein